MQFIKKEGKKERKTIRQKTDKHTYGDKQNRQTDRCKNKVVANLFFYELALNETQYVFFLFMIEMQTGTKVTGVLVGISNITGSCVK